MSVANTVTLATTAQRQQWCAGGTQCLATVLQLLASESFHQLKKFHLGIGV
jgi:hypothetical protein